MDRPLAFIAEHGRPLRGGDIAVGIVEIAEGPVDRTQAIGATGDHHARLRCVPLIGPVVVAFALFVLVGENAVVRVHAADDSRARTGGGGVVGDAEGHGLQPLRGLRDRFDIGHAESGLDQDFDADLLGALLVLLDLRDHHVDRVDVRRHADLRNQHHIETRAVFENVDDVAIAVLRVEAIDAQRHHLLAPVDVVEALNDVLARLLLVVRRNGVLEVEENLIGLGDGGLLKHARRRTWHCELGAMETRRRLLDQCETHNIPLPLVLAGSPKARGDATDRKQQRHFDGLLFRFVLR